MRSNGQFGGVVGAMRWHTGSGLVLAALVVAGCAGDPGRPRAASESTPDALISSTSETPTSTVAPTAAGETAAPQTRVQSTPTVVRTTTKTAQGGTKPGAPGSPIKYDPSFAGNPAAAAEGFLRADLERICGPSLCEIKTALRFEGVSDRDGVDCEVARFEYPSPIPWGGTIVFVVKDPCSRNPNSPKVPSSSALAETTTTTPPGG
jgi:hypothetical protein